ncbi:MAG: helix-turn-helix domain-containing protein [Pseudomonadota bacterium]
MDLYALEARLAAVLAAAQAGLAQVELLGRLWPALGDFARGPLTARAALLQCRQQGLSPDAVTLLALGPEPEPSRPNKALRWAVGHTLAQRRLETDPAEALTPSLVSELFLDLDAPQLARGAALAPDAPWGDGPAPGAAAWSLAPRLVAAGLPPLMALGLTLAAWLRDAPDHPHREPLGWLLAYGLAIRLDLPAMGLLGLGPAVETAAAVEGGLKRVLKEMRTTGAWRQWLGVFLAGVQACASGVLEAALLARQAATDHNATIAAWVRAPRLPLQLLELFLVRPVLDLPSIAADLEVTQRSAGLLANKLKAQGLISEVTGQKRGRRFAYQAVVEVVDPAATAASASN